MTRIVTMAAAVILVLAACGGGGSGGTAGPAGVDRNQQVSAVGDADKSALCAWYVPMVGGYGAPPPCQYGGLSAPPDEADCLAHFPSCAVTVGELEDCIVAIVAAQNTCTPQALAQVQTRADCQAVGAAGCFP